MSTVTAEEEERMRKEIRIMQRKADIIVNEDLQSTRRMLQLVEEAQETGLKTLIKLDEDGEKLNRVEECLEEFHENLNKAEKNIAKMNKFCGLFSCVSKKHYRRSFKKQKNGNFISKNPKFSENSKLLEKPKERKSDFIKRIVNDAREDEMEENLQQVDGVVDQLTTIAQEINTELDRQSKQLTRIAIDTVSTEERLKKANTKAEKLLKH